MTADANVRRSILARQSFWDRIDTEAKRRGVSVNALVKELCVAQLDATAERRAPKPEPKGNATLRPLDTAPAWMRRGWSGGGWR